MEEEHFPRAMEEAEEHLMKEEVEGAVRGLQVMGEAAEHCSWEEGVVEVREPLGMERDEKMMAGKGGEVLLLSEVVVVERHGSTVSLELAVEEELALDLVEVEAQTVHGFLKKEAVLQTLLVWTLPLLEF